MADAMRLSKKTLLLGLMGVLSLPVCAVELPLGGGLKAQLHGTLTWGTQVRTEATNPDVYADWPSRSVPGAAKGRLQGQSGGSDLNFPRGEPISTVLKFVWDLDLKKDQFGLFVRGHAWRDEVLGNKGVAYGHYPNAFQPGQPLNDSSFESSSQFSHAQWREAYLYTDVPLDPDGRLDARWGRQVLQWGRSVLHTNGIQAALNPPDGASSLRPGALPAEGTLPLGMWRVQWDSGAAWRLEGFAAYESRQAVLPACGTYFDVNSFAPPGCDFAALAGASEQSLLASGAYLHRNPDVKARSSGQYGLSLGLKSDTGKTDVQLFAIHTHSTLPSLRMTVNAATPGVRAVNYAMVYPEDVLLWGLSWQHKGSPTTRLFGEVVYRPHQPIQLNAYDVLSGFVTRSPTSLLALSRGITAIPVGGSFDAYDRLAVFTGNFGVDKILPKTMGADRVVWLAEVGFSQVKGLPDASVLRYGRALGYNGAAYVGGPPCVDAVPGKTCSFEGYVSTWAWGLKTRVAATYAHALFGLTWTPSLLWTKDVRGYAHDGAYVEGRQLLRPALRVEHGRHYFAEIQYHRFSGGRYNLLLDRDFVSLVAGARF